MASSAYTFLCENSELPEPNEKPKCTWIKCDTPDTEYRKLALQGIDEEHWFPKFLQLLLTDTRAGGALLDNRFTEILPVTAHCKLAIQIPNYAQHGTKADEVRTTLIKDVCTLLLNDKDHAKVSLSVWFELGGDWYGVWPCIGTTWSNRQAIKKVLQSRTNGRFVPANFAHYDHMVYHFRTIHFPIPAAGATFVGVFDSDGADFTYVARVHRHYKHLTVNGAFAMSRDPHIADEQCLTLTQHLRLGNLTDMTRGTGLKDPGWSALVRTETLAIQRDNNKEHQQQERDRAEMLGEAPPNPAGHIPHLDDDDDWPRLDWSEDYVFSHRRCVAELARLVRDSPQHDYRAAYEYLNRRLLKEGSGNTAPLWMKSYDNNQRATADGQLDSAFLTIVKVSAKDLRQRLEDVKIPVPSPDPTDKKPQYKPLINMWFKHPYCNVVTQVVCIPHPSTDLPLNPYIIDGLFNAWRGWDYYQLGHHQRMCKLHGEKSWAQLFCLDSVTMICTFLYAVLCDSDKQVFRMLMYILTNILLRPDSPTRKAFILLGEEGVGKSLFLSALMKRLLGINHTTTITNAEYAVGNFTHKLYHKLFALFEEAHLNRELAGRLQQLITGETREDNEKYGDIRDEANKLVIFLCSNHDSPLYINEGARRYVYSTVCDLVIRLTDEQKTAFYAPLVHALLNSDGIFEFAYFLTRVNLDEWMAKRDAIILYNHTLAIQKVQSLHDAHPVDGWLYACCTSHELGEIDEGTVTVTDPKDASKVIGTKRKVEKYYWGNTIPLPTLHRLFKQAVRNHGKFANMELFMAALLKALKDADGFRSNGGPVEGAVNEDKPVRSITMPSEAQARYSLQLKIRGIEHASGQEWAESYLTQQQRNKAVSKIDAELLSPLSLLPSPNWLCGDRARLRMHLFGTHNSIRIPANERVIHEPDEDGPKVTMFTAADVKRQKKKKVAPPLFTDSQEAEFERLDMEVEEREIAQELAQFSPERLLHPESPYLVSPSQ